MNKYKEQLETLIRSDIKLHIYKNQDEIIESHQPTIFDFFHKELFSLQELVERETPKKAILVHNYDGLVFECPNCHMEFRPDTIMNHVKWKGCPYCLQNLDWSDEE